MAHDCVVSFEVVWVKYYYILVDFRTEAYYMPMICPYCKSIYSQKETVCTLDGRKLSPLTLEESIEITLPLLPTEMIQQESLRDPCFSKCTQCGTIFDFWLDYCLNDQTKLYPTINYRFEITSPLPNEDEKIARFSANELLIERNVIVEVLRLPYAADPNCVTNFMADCDNNNLIKRGRLVDERPYAAFIS